MNRQSTSSTSYRPLRPEDRAIPRNNDSSLSLESRSRSVAQSYSDLRDTNAVPGRFAQPQHSRQHHHTSARRRSSRSRSPTARPQSERVDLRAHESRHWIGTLNDQRKDHSTGRPFTLDQPVSTKRQSTGDTSTANYTGPVVSDEQDADLESQMAKAMGFTTFATTKGQSIAGNSTGGANVKKPTAGLMRQYMQRQGGFNRPLDVQKAYHREA